MSAHTGIGTLDLLLQALGVAPRIPGGIIAPSSVRTVLVTPYHPRALTLTKVRHAIIEA